MLRPVPAQNAALQHGAKGFSTWKVSFSTKMCLCMDKNPTYFYARKQRYPNNSHGEILFEVRVKPTMRPAPLVLSGFLKPGSCFHPRFRYFPWPERFSIHQNHFYSLGRAALDFAAFAIRVHLENWPKSRSSGWFNKRANLLI